MAAELSPYRKNDEMGRIGKALVGQLFVLFKTSLNYAEGHSAIDTPIANVLKLVHEILRRNEEAALRIKGGNFYLGELRLKSDSLSFEAGRFVMEEMKRHLVGGITFGLAATASDLMKFVYVFREVDASPSPDVYADILERMQAKMILSIEVETLPQEVEMVEIDSETQKDRKDKKGGKLNARALYKKALTTMDEVMDNAGEGQPLRLRASKRVVQHMIDLLPNNEPSLLGLTTMRSSDRKVQNHAVNVCLLSLVMGRRLGISKYHLCELGMAALFHDIGKTDIPREIQDKQGELTPNEQQMVETHPIHGVKQIMKSKGLDIMSSRIITGVFEHHLLADFSGYPRFPYKRLSLFGRIISIADCYDGLTSSPVHGRAPYPPDKAIRFMLTRAGRAYDRGLLKLFINCVGVHGIGSLLLLDNGELAVVVENNPARRDIPRIRVIADANGREVDREVEDLALPGAIRKIAANLDPNPFNLDVSRYFP
jgi:HD-GYP domain-containing protein (c-di-GMP phosphodiesterase class II)